MILITGGTGFLGSNILFSLAKEKKIISNLKIGQVSKPIRTTSGFIILKIEDEKKYSNNLSLTWFF